VEYWNEGKVNMILEEISEGKRTITDPSGILNLLLIVLVLSLLIIQGRKFLRRELK
jgi:hypothetical protein